MKNISKFTILLLVLIGCLTVIRAQNNLLVKENSGTQTAFAISNTKKLAFTAGKLVVSMKDGVINNFNLSDLRSLNFGDGGSTDISPAKSLNDKNFVLFPNPVIDDFQVQFITTISELVHVQILDLKGSIIYQQSVVSKSGTNHITILAIQLKSGFYIFNLLTRDKLESTKFIKK